LKKAPTTHEGGTFNNIGAWVKMRKRGTRGNQALHADTAVVIRTLKIEQQRLQKRKGSDRCTTNEGVPLKKWPKREVGPGAT